MKQPRIFRKRPTTAEAIQWTGENESAVQAWTGRSAFHAIDPGDMVDNEDATGALFVAANGAWLGLVTGEWIIKDGKGFYPCKPDIFETSYHSETGWVALAGQIVGTAENWQVCYRWDNQFYKTKEGALIAGFPLAGDTDDFNIGRVENGVLVWFGWQDNKHPEEDYEAVAEQFGWTVTCSSSKAAS